MIQRIYVEKRDGSEADAILKDIQSYLELPALTGLRVLHRYDVEGCSEDAMRALVRDVFSEPALDEAYTDLPSHSGTVFAVESLPGQFDQRADSAEQCAQLILQGERPRVRAARVYLFDGELTEHDVHALKRLLINAVECREASMALPSTLAQETSVPAPTGTVEGFAEMNGEALRALHQNLGLAMDLNDLECCRAYFASEGRDATLAELRVLDTYWSDHCRHTTFSTQLIDVTLEGEDERAAYEEYLRAHDALRPGKPVTLMDVATLGAKALKAQGKLDDVDESEEVNACTVRINARVDGQDEDWLLLFKNETHNHPTEIEPFGGAATCIGGAIRDPLSGRAWVSQAMRVTGASDPRLSATLTGKLPPRKLTTTAAAGFSAYGNQIGLATGMVREYYHPGYAAKRLELGAVVGACPRSHVRRETPKPGDIILLLGGRTGRDGCGGATGSSKAHTASSLTECGAEVQKGNAPEERKLQRLMRNPEAARLIKRCNDFGAGGVAVAVGEIADGLNIDLDAVPVKYDGLTGTELAISESQERMAVALDPNDVNTMIALAASENLQATRIARVTDDNRLVMRHQGRVIVDIDRGFLSQNGAPKTASVLGGRRVLTTPDTPRTFAEGARAWAARLSSATQRGLIERFDSTVGAGSVLMPLGGARQRTPAQAMVALLPAQPRKTDTCSVMACGFAPRALEESPYHGAYASVLQSLCKLVATGAPLEGAHLSLQEYFERMRENNWDKPLCALLGAYRAQMDYGVAAIGGKDSMSGTFVNLDVPPTLVSFAVSACGAERVISPEFRRAGSRIWLLAPKMLANGLPDAEDMRRVLATVQTLTARGAALSISAVEEDGVLGAVVRACLGNRIGVSFDAHTDHSMLFAPMPGAFIIECGEPVGMPLATLTADYALRAESTGERVSLDELETQLDSTLEDVFPVRAAKQPDQTVAPAGAPAVSIRARRGASSAGKPRVLIPVFPGTNCELDAEAAFLRAGAQVTQMLVRNLSARDVRDSSDAFAAALDQSEILFIPGGFSCGDEPDGSAKMICAFLRAPRVQEAIERALNVRDGLIGGVCNGFQALIKLGLLPYGELRPQTHSSPTLTYNRIGRHQSRLVRTRVNATPSPWLALSRAGDIYAAPISHGEGRVTATDEELDALFAHGQIATQYVDDTGSPTMNIEYNPSGSARAIEGLCSPDGRVFGRMAHSERAGAFLYKNVPHTAPDPMFESAVRYFL